MSTYTESLGLELITPGSQAGLWGNTANNTFTLIDQAITGVTPISFAAASGSTYTLTDFNGAADESRSAVINITGTASGANTIVVPNKQKTYLVRNNTGQDVVFRTASPTATYTVGAGYSILIFCDGNNNVFTGIASPGVGTLSVNAGGTGATTFTAGFVKSTGGTNALVSSTTVNLSAEASGTLPVANGGTGQTSLTSGTLLVGNGTGSVAVLSGGTVGYVPTWNGSTWVSAAPITGNVASVFGRTGTITAQSTDYSSFYPSLTGTGATGTWGINITGNAATATTASTATNVTASGSNPITMTTNGFTRMTVASSTGYVGIGTTNPQRRLHVVGASGPVSTFPTVGANDCIIMENNANANINAVTPVAGDYKASYPGASGPYAQMTLVYNGGSPQISFAVNQVGKMRVQSDAVYIEQSNSQGSYNLQVGATGVWAFGPYVNGSDAKLKDNVKSLDSCLDLVSAMRPVTYKYKSEYSKDLTTQTGFIAQELKGVFAEKDYLEGLVRDDAQQLNVAYQNIIPILTKAIQELKAEVDALKAAK